VNRLISNYSTAVLPKTINSSEVWELS
jgi:hypothetical protein